MGVRDAILRKILGLAENEGIQAGEKSLAKGVANKAELEGADDILRMNPSLANDLDPLAQKAIQQQGIESTLNKLPPRSPADLSSEVFEKSAPNFDMVGAPRTEIPKGGQNFTMSEPPSGNVPMVNGSGNLPMVPPVGKRGGFYEGESGLPAVVPNKPMSNWEHVLDLAKQNKLPIGLGVGATALGATMMPQQMDKGGGPPIGDGGLTDLPGFPSKKAFGPQDLLADKKEEPEEEVSEERAPANEAAQSPKSDGAINKTPKKSDTQSLADLLAQEPQGEKYADVQKRKQLAILANELGSAGDIIGGAIAHNGPNEAAQKLFKNNIAGAESITNDFKDKKAMEEQDPNSAVSQNYRKFLERYGVSAGPGITAAQVKATLLPAAEKESLLKERLQAQRENKEMQLEYLKAHKEQTKVAQDLKRQDMLDKQATQDVLKANKLISSEIASSRSSFGRAANTHQAAEKILAMVQDIDPNDLNNRQITEIARNLDGMLSNGQPTISGLTKLLPKSAQGDFAKIKEYISNIPKGAQQGAFVQNMIDTVNREKGLADRQVRKTQGELLSGFNKYKDHPEMQQMLRMRGLPLDIFEKQGSGSTLPPSVKSKSNEVERFDPKTNKTAIFDANTKQFLRYKD